MLSRLVKSMVLGNQNWNDFLHLRMQVKSHIEGNLTLEFSDAPHSRWLRIFGVIVLASAFTYFFIIVASGWLDTIVWLLAIGMCLIVLFASLFKVSTLISITRKGGGYDISVRRVARFAALTVSTSIQAQYKTMPQPVIKVLPSAGSEGGADTYLVSFEYDKGTPLILGRCGSRSVAEKLCNSVAAQLREFAREDRTR